MDAEITAAQPGSIPGALDESRNPALIAAYVEVSSSVQMKDIPAFVCQTFHQIDGPVHQSQHVGVRPPVTITLRASIAREGKRRALVHEQDITHPGLAQEIGRANA